MNNMFKNNLFVLALLVHSSTEKLHDGFTVCKVKESNFESCLDRAIENGIKFIKEGLPDYNLPSLDPLYIPSLTVGAGVGPVNTVQDYKDLVITGFSDITVNNSHVDFDKKVLRFSAMYPSLIQKGQYSVHGKLLMLPVYGTGSCSLTLENTYSDNIIEFEEVKNQGEVYYSPKSYNIKLHPNHATYLFENLFDGNKLLGDNINKLLNREWLAIFQDVAGGYEKAYAKYFLQFSKGIFDKVPVNEIFIQ